MCVYPAFVQVASEELAAQGMSHRVRVATVANFPGGAPDPAAAAREVRAAVDAGAHEVDVVFPWRTFLDGDAAVGAHLVADCREACGELALLKVILETGELRDPDRIRAAAGIAAESGAAFLKTSTGKTPVGATPEAVEILLGVARAFGGEVGVKISGGVRTAEQARGYLARVAEVMGREWISPARVRFGASSLMRDLLSGS